MNTFKVRVWAISNSAVLLAWTSAPRSTLRRVMVPANGATTRRYAYSADSRPTSARLESRLASALLARARASSAASWLEMPPLARRACRSAEARLSVRLRSSSPRRAWARLSSASSSGACSSASSWPSAHLVAQVGRQLAHEAVQAGVDDRALGGQGGARQHQLRLRRPQPGGGHRHPGRPAQLRRPGVQRPLPLQPREHARGHQRRQRGIPNSNPSPGPRRIRRSHGSRQAPRWRHRWHRVGWTLPDQIRIGDRQPGVGPDQAVDDRHEQQRRHRRPDQARRSPPAPGRRSARVPSPRPSDMGNMPSTIASAVISTGRSRTRPGLQRRPPGVHPRQPLLVGERDHQDASSPSPPRRS